MPIIQGADLTNVSTEFELYPAGEYVATVKESEFANDNKQLRIKSVFVEPVEYAGKVFTDFINLVQNDGKQNQYGLASVKQYLEAVFGKNSPEAEASPPDTDVLNGHNVKLVLAINEYTPKPDKATEFNPDGSPKKKSNNQVKRVLPA